MNTKYRVTLGHDCFGAAYLYVRQGAAIVSTEELSVIARELEAKLNAPGGEVHSMALEINTLTWEGGE